MRLLHQRHGHGRRGASASEPERHARRCAEGACRQPLPLRNPRATPARDRAGSGEGDGMSAPVSRREFLQASAALLVGFTTASVASAQRLPRAEAVLGKTLDVSDVDGFIAIAADGSVTIYSGKVDLGQGLRIAIPQM